MTDKIRPLLNPVLKLKKMSKTETVTGRGKKETEITRARLADQRMSLSSSLNNIYQRLEGRRIFGNQVQIIANMFDDAISATKLPSHLFHKENGAQIILPMRNAYLVEVDTRYIPKLSEAIQASTNMNHQVDIANIQELKLFSDSDVRRHNTVDELWNDAPKTESGRRFVLSFLPCRSDLAQKEVSDALIELADKEVFLPTQPNFIHHVFEDRRAEIRIDNSPEQSSLAIALREYRNSGRARFSVNIGTKEKLVDIIASGTVYRIDPVSPIKTTDPGEGAHPIVPHADFLNQPIVGILDGGFSADSYFEAEAWRAPLLVEDFSANKSHGNKVSVLASHGFAWNQNLSLPPLVCRFGTAQCVPKDGHGHLFDPDQLIKYMDTVFSSQPNTKVWNMSFNQQSSCSTVEMVIPPFLRGFRSRTV